MKTYCVADMHGRHDLLMRALATCAEHSGDTPARFLVMGDFVDRGPRSREIINTLMKGSYRSLTFKVLKGNHEAMMVECLTGGAPMRWWVGNGGGQTLISYGYKNGDPIMPYKGKLKDHMAWINTLPIAHEDEHRIFVHAGVPYDQQISEAKPETMMWMLYPGDVDHDDAEFHPDEGHVSGKHIVHGHHQSWNHPLLKEHRTNLDAFAWYTGRLAIGVFDDDKPGGPEEILWAEAAPMGDE